MSTLTAARTKLALAGLLALGLAAYVGLFLNTTVTSFVRAPFGDGFDIVAVEFEAQDRGDPGGYLWHPHNGHHIVWLRLLTSLDVRLFHGQSTIFLVAALLAILAATGVIVRQILAGVENRAQALALAAIGPFALLTSLNAFDVSVPINTPYVFAMAFAVAAFALAEGRGTGLPTVAGLLALSAGAAMGNSVGLATVPVLMAAILRRPERGRLPWFWVAGPILVAVFVATAGPISVGAEAQAATLPERALRGLRYFASFCGLPWSASSERMPLPGGLQAVTRVAGPALGVLLAALGAALAARPAGGEAPRDRLDRFCSSLILFSLAAAAMAALGRVDARPDAQIPVRYSVLMAPLHIGVLVLLATRFGGRVRLGGGAKVGLLAAVLLAALAHQYAGAHVVRRYCSTIVQTAAAFDRGERTPEMTLYVYPRLDHAEAMTAEMKRRGLYQFR